MGLRQANVSLLPFAEAVVSPWVWENDLIGRQLLKGEIWDRPILEHMMTYIKPGSLFIDVGAHVGFYSLASLHLGAISAVAYEPYLYDLLRINCAGLPISAVGVALGDRGCRAMWKPTPHAQFSGNYPTPQGVVGLGGLGGLSLKQLDPPESYYEDSVSVVTLDSEYTMIRQSGIPISMIKIDAQGWDLKVLRGAIRMIAHHLPVILFEYESDLSEEPLAEYLQFFNERKYQVSRIAGLPNDWVAVPQ